MEQYKPNSNRSKEEKPDIKLEPVAKGVVKKETFFERLWSDFKKACSFVWTDILIPAGKKSLSEGINNVADIMIYGENKKATNVPAGRVSYRSYYEQPRDRYYAVPRQVQAATPRYDEIVYPTRGDADAVLNALDNTIRKYGIAKVSDLYDFSDIQGSYTDNNYGWTDLSYAEVVRNRDGYSLKLPKAMPID